MNYVSASQIKVWNECQRKWAWSYVAGFRSPAGPGALLGTEVDDTQLQPYLRDGIEFDYTRPSGSGAIAASILAYLPKPKTPGLKVQAYFEMPSPTWVGEEHIGFSYRGYKDLTLPDSGLLPGLEPGRPVVVDFKTSSNIGAYALNEVTLATDVQAMIYATHTMFETRAREVDLVWLYMPTRGKKPRRVHLKVTSEHVAKQFRAIDETAVNLFKTKQASIGKDPTEFVLSLPFNDEMCEKYGGCEYRSKCNLSPDQIVNAHAARDGAKRGCASESGETYMAIDMIARMKVLKSGGTASELMPTPMPVQLSAPVSVGINPPEAALPPASPVGSVPVSAAVTVTEAPATTGKRRGPGRPKTDEIPSGVVEGSKEVLFSTPSEPVEPDTTVKGKPASSNPIYFEVSNKTELIEYRFHGNLNPGETYPDLLKRLGLEASK